MGNGFKLITTKIFYYLQLVTLALLVAAANAGLLPQSSVLLQQPQLIQRVAQPILHQQALVAHAQPTLLAHAQPAIAVAKQVEEYDPHPQYNFAYDIQDSLTGDSKNQQESRDGDVVQGQYSLTDPDGHRRTVTYTADPINGFNAVVQRQPLGHAVVAHQPATVIAQPATVLAHQPTLLQQQAPVVTVARNIHGQQLLSHY